MRADANGKLLSFADGVDFPAAALGEAFGRWPNAQGALYPMQGVSLGAVNPGPRIGPVIISEVMYNPFSGNDDLEFVELYNPTNQAVNLGGWKFGAGVDFQFDASTLIAPRATLLVTRFNPQTDVDKLAAFQLAYGIGSEVPIVGGYTGVIDNGGESLRLVRPDTPPPNEPNFTPYVMVEHEGERYVLARDRLQDVLPDAHPVGGELTGATLVGSRYEALYPNVEGAHRVVAADFVSLEDGTGVVHLAPAFGPEDLEIGRREGWATFKPLDGEGRFTDQAPTFVRGEFFKDADEAITADLRSRGLLLRAGTLIHAYPLCWRCDTPLIYIARSSWYVRTTAAKERLLEVNDEVDWYPDHIKHGRYGDWLRNNVDWALSRERYWGTPLPIWRCEQGHDTAIGSLNELSELAGRDVTELDPHRPGIDEVTFPCPTCGGVSTRVPEVIDTWYDSGAMPYAQWGYHPELGRGLERFEESFPADFISEAIDQTRGWFYTLMAEGVLLFDSTAYRTVVCLGHLVDRDGRKMSKSLGNTVDAFEVMDRQGADALRWFLLTGGSPWSPRRVSMEMFDDVVRQFLLPLWNVYAFFVTYANASGFDPSDSDVPVERRPLLDRWVLSQLSRTEAAARDGLQAYDATGAGRRIAAFVEDLSNWYVRRARRRFWDPDGEGGDDVRAAFHTLHTCLVSLAQLLAPFTPFVAETLWRNLAAGRDGAPVLRRSALLNAGEVEEVGAGVAVAQCAGPDIGGGARAAGPGAPRADCRVGRGDLPGRRSRSRSRTWRRTR
jgi:isoleucyl-tRNA synthetase